MACIQVKVGHSGVADNRRPIRRHRTQASPEGCVRRVAAAGEQVVHTHFESLSPGLTQALIKSYDFRHAAYADSLVETGDGDFVGFVEDR